MSGGWRRWSARWTRLGLRIGTGVTLVVAAPFAPAQDAQWDFTPRVAAGQIFTDNITLAPPGEEDHEHVTELNAGFSLERAGRGARAELDYNLQALGYWRDSSRNDVFHQMAGQGSIDVVPERFFIEGSTAFGQRQVTRDGAIGDNINVTGNRTDVFNLRVSPVLQQRLGEVATAQLRYTYDRTDYSGSGASSIDSESNRVLARLDDGPMFSRIGWGLRFERTETDFDDGSSVTFQSAEALGRWRFTERLSVFAAVGEEDNDFEQDPRRARPDDSFWRAGATYEPGARTFIEAYGGERYFGTTYGGTLRHRLRTGRLTATYDEGLTTVNEFVLSPVMLPVLDGVTGEPVIIDGRPLFAELELPDLQIGVFLSKRFTAGFAGERRKLGWGVRVFDERREFELTDRRERVQGVTGNLAWRWRPRTQLFANASVQESSFSEENRDDTLLFAALGVGHDLGAQTRASLEYSYRDRDTNTGRTADYRENRVTVRLQKAF